MSFGPDEMLAHANALLVGYGVPADVSEGLSLLRKLAVGYGEAAATLAGLNAAGLWMPRDWDAALDLLARGAGLGSARAAAQLSLIAPSGRAGATTQSLFAVPPRVSLCEGPRVRLAENFVPHAWCDWLIAKAQGRLATATIGYHGGQASDARSNSTFALTVFDMDCVVSLIRDRIAVLTGLTVAAMELPQILHYAVGQEFRLHADTIRPVDGAGSERIATFLLYLNDDFDGGETWFPRGPLKVKPAKGGALYFANVGPDQKPDPLSVHAGLAPTRGEKFLFSQWIHDGVPNGAAR